MALCNDDYSLCYDEHHISEEWKKVFRARPNYNSITSGLVTDEDKQKMNDKENQSGNGLDKDHSRVLFLAYHQLVAYHHWLLFCPDEAALFQRVKVSQFMCLG
jgi:hypothetical protein